MKPKTYKEAGVDIARGEALVDIIRGIGSHAISASIGGFAGEVEFDVGSFVNPVLLCTTDGVGTKLLVAKKLQEYQTIGIDLVAMSVNDLAARGARPLAFQDYIACSRINRFLLSEVIKGIARGCEIAGCRLNGGETAELPDMYAGGDIDLAGFCVGVAERDKMLPRLDSIRKGDLLFGLPSSGIHSNGLSLARKVLSEDKDYRELLIPTRIYVDEINSFQDEGLISAAAHITGGGLIGNISRIVPDHLRANLSYDCIVPDIFRRIQANSRASNDEMRRTFNLGIGMVVVASPHQASRLSEMAAEKGFGAVGIGEIEERIS